MDNATSSSDDENEWEKKARSMGLDDVQIEFIRVTSRPGLAEEMRKKVREKEAQVQREDQRTQRLQALNGGSLPRSAMNLSAVALIEIHPSRRDSLLITLISGVLVQLRHSPKDNGDMDDSALATLELFDRLIAQGSGFFPLPADFSRVEPDH